MKTMKKMKALRVLTAHKAFIVELADGGRCTVPWSVTQRLADGNENERATCVLLGNGQGLWWPLIDEDLSVEGLVRDYGTSI